MYTLRFNIDSSSIREFCFREPFSWGEQNIKPDPCRTEDLRILSCYRSKIGRVTGRKSWHALETAPGTQWRPWTNKHTTRYIRPSARLRNTPVPFRMHSWPSFRSGTQRSTAPPSAGQTAVEFLCVFNPPAHQVWHRVIVHTMIRQKSTPMCVYSSAHSSQTRYGVALPRRKDRTETRGGAEDPRANAYAVLDICNIGICICTCSIYTLQNGTIVTGTIPAQFDLQYAWPTEATEKQAWALLSPLSSVAICE